ncbi:hypothetical protein B0H15DRAFT_945961 [Mycena belliarum]|uniref:Uncharacterized protein n=1 Tax=Mycena belliarum TaxID=1033014 RepID=A0AAD6XR61_9AGAR|nr:hypothetical protein B0H15DRAFT_945961 [Mycena belliae]
MIEVALIEVALVLKRVPPNPAIVALVTFGEATSDNSVSHLASTTISHLGPKVLRSPQTPEVRAGLQPKHARGRTYKRLKSAPDYNPSMRAVVPTNAQLKSAPDYNPSMRAVVPTNAQLKSAPDYNPSMRAVVPTIVRPFCRSEGVGFRVAFIGPSQRHAFRDILACYVFPSVVSPPSTPKPPACTT